MRTSSIDRRPSHVLMAAYCPEFLFRLKIPNVYSEIANRAPLQTAFNQWRSQNFFSQGA